MNNLPQRADFIKALSFGEDWVKLLLRTNDVCGKERTHSRHPHLSTGNRTKKIPRLFEPGEKELIKSI